jgi:hypothetical protein|tara:strand:- start:184 stop:360 length:177 start_codon:yes stop_codon:yes gene_type:complete
MNKRDRKYWEQHKEVMNQELEKLNRINIREVFNDPHGKAAKQFAAKVGTLTKRELELS